MPFTYCKNKIEILIPFMYCILPKRCVCVKHTCILNFLTYLSGADQGFLERGFICIKVWGVVLLILSHFSLISHETEIIWSH